MFIKFNEAAGPYSTPVLLGVVLLTWTRVKTCRMFMCTVVTHMGVARLACAGKKGKRRPALTYIMKRKRRILHALIFCTETIIPPYTGHGVDAMLPFEGRYPHCECLSSFVHFHSRAFQPQPCSLRPFCSTLSRQVNFPGNFRPTTRFQCRKPQRFSRIPPT